MNTIREQPKIQAGVTHVYQVFTTAVVKRGLDFGQMICKEFKYSFKTFLQRPTKQEIHLNITFTVPR